MLGFPPWPLPAEASHLDLVMGRKRGGDFRGVCVWGRGRTHLAQLGLGEGHRGGVGLWQKVGIRGNCTGPGSTGRREGRGIPLETSSTPGTWSPLPSGDCCREGKAGGWGSLLPGSKRYP